MTNDSDVSFTYQTHAKITYVKIHTYVSEMKSNTFRTYRSNYGRYTNIHYDQWTSARQHVSYVG